MTTEVEITVAAAAWDGVQDAQAVVRRAIAACEARLEDSGETVEMSVVLSDDAEIRRLNREWRGKDSATNVLSFPTAPGPSGEQHLGDVIIAFETLVREAAEEHKSFSAHLAHLVVHGYLHLLGYDHEVAEQAEDMEQLERDILADLGIEDPYAGAPLMTTATDAMMKSR
jgi:probable rRNA maturation factor